MSAVQAAQGAARKALEATYFGTMTITEMKKVKDIKSKLTTSQPIVVLENQPCKLSFETLNTAAQSESAAAVHQVQNCLYLLTYPFRQGLRSLSHRLALQQITLAVVFQQYI